MIDALQFLWPPFLVAVCLVGIHAYFGIQVLARKVIFVDLALAQIAALGATVAPNAAIWASARSTKITLRAST